MLKELMRVGDLNKSKDFLEGILKCGHGLSIFCTLESLQQLNQEIGIGKSKESILNEILADANYTLLVSKQETIDTIRI